MRLLLDTGVLLWSVGQSDRLSDEARQTLDSPRSMLTFSVISIREVGIKVAKGLVDLPFHPAVIRRALLDEGWVELAVSGDHVLAAAALPPIHRDPFDRMLVAQAMVEGALTLTSDRTVARHPGPVRLV